MNETWLPDSRGVPFWLLAGQVGGAAAVHELLILPVAVFGSSSVNVTPRGALKRASRSRTKPISMTTLPRGFPQTIGEDRPHLDRIDEPESHHFGLQELAGGVRRALPVPRIAAS